MRFKFSSTRELIGVILKKVAVCVVLIIVYYVVLISSPPMKEAGLKVGVNTAALFPPISLFTAVLTLTSILGELSEKTESHRLAEYLQVAREVSKYASIAILVETTYYARQSLTPIAPILDYARTPSLLIISGLTLKSMGDIILNVASPPLRGAGYLLIALGLRDALKPIPVSGLPEAILYTGVAAFILSSLGCLSFSRRRSLALLGKYCWDRAGTFSLLTFLAAMYFSLKSYVAMSEQLESYLFFVETAAAIIVILLVADGVYTHFNRTFTLRCIEEGWEIHKSKVTFYEDPSFKELESALERFIREGVKEELLIALSYYLGKTKASPSDVREILAPLIKYEEPLVPVLAPRWSKRRTLRSLMARRVEVVNKIHKSIINRLREKG